MPHTTHTDQQHRILLRAIAHRVMLERGLLPDFSKAVQKELEGMEPSEGIGKAAQDLRELPWASIDNEDSQDLDQLTVAEALPGGKVKIMVAVADVEATVLEGSAVDAHAQHNTTSVYTAAEIFPMLPEKLSTDLTSLKFNEDRLAMVIEMVVGADGVVGASAIYQAWVHNHAKLVYQGVADWLERNEAMPEAIGEIAGLAENLRLQDRTAQAMQRNRQSHGALSLETREAKPLFTGDQLSDLAVEEKNRAKQIIEDFMIATNGVTARYLTAKNYPTIRRVVRTPKRWERIVEVARGLGFRLSDDPDPRSLEKFLVKQKAIDPLHFPDLSLTIIKLLGAGEYIAMPGGSSLQHGAGFGHFGLAVKDYTHSTAPNRRYPDLITQRLLKAAVLGKAAPYRMDELEALARHCTEAEDAANKVERQVGKSAAALLLESRLGEIFDGIVTGAAAKGTWVRLLSLPVEGKLVEGYAGVDVGERLRVQLVEVDVDQGYIDFRKVR